MTGGAPTISRWVAIALDYPALSISRSSGYARDGKALYDRQATELQAISREMPRYRHRGTEASYAAALVDEFVARHGDGRDHRRPHGRTSGCARTGCDATDPWHHPGATG